MINDHQQQNAVRRPTADGDLILSLLGSPASAGLARTLTGHRLKKWNCRNILDDALLVVTELVTNAAEETPGRELGFRLGRTPHDVLIAVWDSSPRLPRPRPLTELTLDDLDRCEETFDSGGGWGLPIVQALSTSCGCDRTPPTGKWTWARLTP